MGEVHTHLPAEDVALNGRPIRAKAVWTVRTMNERDLVELVDLLRLTPSPGGDWPEDHLSLGDPNMDDRRNTVTVIFGDERRYVLSYAEFWTARRMLDASGPDVAVDDQR